MTKLAIGACPVKVVTIKQAFALNNSLFFYPRERPLSNQESSATVPLKEPPGKTDKKVQLGNSVRGGGGGVGGGGGACTLGI